MTQPSGITASPTAPGGSVERIDGRYALIRPLSDNRWGERWLGLHVDRNTSHLIHRLTRCSGPGPNGQVHLDRLESAIEHLRSVTHPHVLQIDRHGCHGPWGHDLWVVTDYTGDADGVVCLDRLLTVKGGWLTVEESKRAIEQLMDACASAHSVDVAHGPLSMDQVQIDRRGSLLIEHYGLANTLVPTPSAREDEVRSILAIGYQLVTGLLPVSPVIPVQHVVPGIDPTWADLFDTGLGRPGFATSAHALAAVRSLRIAGGLGDVGSTFSSAIRSMLTPTR